ncbi:restriction endonuclease [Rathayibacter sp. AY1G1]|uniref:BREX-1 system adenine-specific DNA-methyltransferase PglX n=1 Tax=Rathayibacter sp. AY1G1 TaxID=2080564 RepID=UPI000CE82787|nr:BREX-1 system adenine-specific DNA-methyltransferase PglX [Rathayibacter sp. AY1G1]PPH10481.1 restriction endonuclease [Rathayibacter sp. AY1G1]
METAPLKSFATWARTELIREVGARIASVLAPGSSERVEEAPAIEALERAVKAAGDEAAGRAKVADTVAYTWFNRIIALRFMDANGYSGIGVVSPHRGQTSGQPEVLVDAKRGVIDTEIVGKRTAGTVTALLDSTRRSIDPHGEAYSLLLSEYCRHWHRSMPFMFEREGDYTELLIPANLLADNSVLARSVIVLTEDVCQDVEVIGWLYQFYISERKEEVFAGFKRNKKAGADEIPAATQLFTPHWIVRYLVENTLGRLWMLNHPGSRLVDQMDYYVAPVNEEASFLKIGKAEELTVIDPACGSGHMLTYAFDLLYAIYEEQGEAPAEIPGKIIVHNLYGAEIDPRAGALAAFALTMKARARQRTFFSKQARPNICVIDPISFSADELSYLVTKDGDRHAEEAFWNQFAEADTYGSLIQTDHALTARLDEHLATLDDEGDMLHADALNWGRKAIHQATFLSARRSVLVANPPYMDARNMSGPLYEFVVENFPEGFTGIDLAFVLRSRSLVQPKGYLGLLTMDSWLGNVECADFRDVVRDALLPRIVLQLGPRAFPQIAGEVVQVAATIFENSTPGTALSTFIGATTGATTDAKIAQFKDLSRRYTHPLDWFDVFPGRVFTPYAASETAHTTFASAPTMKSIAEVRTGLQTGDNTRFLRQWFEVSFSSVRLGGSKDTSRWVPYVKSASATRWFAREDLVVDWSSDGADIRAHPSSVLRNSTYYFRPGLSYGGLAGYLKARFVSEGAIFDQKNSMVFTIGSTTTEQLLALMNSPAFEALARLVSSKGFGVGTLAHLPIPKEILAAPRIEEIARRAIELSRTGFDRSETSRGFGGLESIFLGAEINPSLRINVESTLDRDVRTQSELTELEAENALLFQMALLAESRESSDAEPSSLPYTQASIVRDLISYAVGCMFGRYSLDEPGPILADQGATLQDFLAKVPSPSFTPDADGVIPIVDGDWFEDDIVGRFRQFLRTAFGQSHFEENLWFITESLGAKSLRDYFVKSFYKDHSQRYKKRPIYWLFSSPKGSFNALIYMHRYSQSTVSTVLNDYLRQFQAKLQASLTQAERSNNIREVDRLRKVLVELNQYEHDVLYPLATQTVAIDLNDGVKANYPKFGSALKKIPGLEAAE